MTSTSTSYWQSTSSPVPLQTDVPGTVDIAVVGAGLLGAATTYWLARTGASVALLERSAPAYGATGRNGGFVRIGPARRYVQAIARLGHETAYAVMRLTSESKDLLRQVVDEEKIDCAYREPGSLSLAINEEQYALFKQEVAVLEADGFAATLLEREHVQEAIKTPLGSSIIGGLFLPNQGLVHSARLVQGLVQAALRRGARAYQVDVQQLLPEQNYVRLQTSSGELQAKVVVLAVNAWTGKLLPALSDVIVPAREQMLAYAPLPPVFSTAVSAHMMAGEYWQQTPDGTILIGGCSTAAPNEDMGVWEMVPSTPVQEAIEKILPQLFPSLAPLQVVQRWAGLLGCTTDRHPIVDRVPNMSNVLMVGGFTGHGMPFGMRFGQLLAEAAITGVMPSPLAPYRLDRPTLKKWSDGQTSAMADF